MPKINPATLCRECSCVTDQLQEGRCKVELPPKPRTVVSCEIYKIIHDWRNKICDGLVFWHDRPSSLSVAVVELKGGSVPSDAIKQLQEGAKIAEGLATSKVLSFAAILVTNKGPHAVDQRVFNRGVYFAGRRYPIQIMKCGNAILSALPWANR